MEKLFEGAGGICLGASLSGSRFFSKADLLCVLLRTSFKQVLGELRKCKCMVHVLSLEVAYILFILFFQVHFIDDRESATIVDK